MLSKSYFLLVDDLIRIYNFYYHYSFIIHILFVTNIEELCESSAIVFNTIFLHF